MKKIIAMILVIVLCCAVSIGLTVAYLTDRDSAANIFTVGNVAIDLTEDFEQGAMLIPGVDIEKKPYIENTGNIDAWVWATVAIPTALDNEFAYNNVVHFNYTKESVADGLWTWMDGTDWMIRTEKINGVDYTVYTILYQTPLKPGEKTTEPFMTKVYVDPHIDIDPDGNWWHVENGVVSGKDAQTPFWNSNTDGAPVFYVSAYAIQTQNFATVQAAYAAYNTQWDVPGTPEIEGTEYGNVIIANPTETVRPAAYIPAAEGETIENLVVVDNSAADINLRALYTKNGAGTFNMTGNLTVKDSYLDGTYAMNVTADPAAGAELVCENTAFLGWVSYDGWKTATFTNCTFQINTNNEFYNNIRPYETTTFTGCEFKGTTLWMDKMEGTINFVGCTYNGQPLTAEILNSMIVEAPTAAATILLDGAAFTYVAP